MGWKDTITDDDSPQMSWRDTIEDDNQSVPNDGLGPDAQAEKENYIPLSAASSGMAKPLKAIGGGVLDALSYLGRGARTALGAMGDEYTMGDVGDQLSHLNPENTAKPAPSGRKLLDMTGLTDAPEYEFEIPKDPEALKKIDPKEIERRYAADGLKQGLYDALGFGAEIATDPLTYAAVPGKIVNRLTKGKALENTVSKLTPMAEEASAALRPPAMRADADEIIKAGERIGVKVTPGMLDESGYVERLEGSVAKSPSIWGRGVAKDQAKVLDGLEGAAADLTSDATALSPYQVGEKFKSGVGEAINTRLDPLAETFENVAKSTKDIPISPRATAAVKRNIEAIPEFAMTGGRGKPGEYLEMIGNLKTADQVKSAMTLLNNDIRAAQGAEKQVLLAMKVKLATLEKNSIMRGAIQAAREGEGVDVGRGLVDELRGARKGWREASQDLGEVAKDARVKMRDGPRSFVDAVDEIPSERITDKFFNPENNRQLMTLKEKFPEQAELLRTSKLRDIQDVAGGSTAKFVKETARLNPEAKAALFQGKTQALSDVEKLHSSLPRNFNPSGTASEASWQNALYSNVKDLPNAALYKTVTSKGFRATANSIADVVKNSPQALGKFATVLQKAAERGPQAVASTHFILQQTKPEYREMINNLSEGGFE